MSGAVRVVGAGAVSAVASSLSAAARRPEGECTFAGPAGERAAYPAPFDPRRDLSDVSGIRRLGRQAAMALAAALEASASLERLPEETAIVVGTAHGAVAETVAFLESARDDAARYASPTAFAGSLHASMASPISKALGIRGPMLVISDGDRSFETALIAAIELLGRGEAPYALVGACDAYHPETRRALASFGAVSSSLLPIDQTMTRTERGVHLGEGAGFLLIAPGPLESEGVRITRVEVAAREVPRVRDLRRVLALADGSTRSGLLHAAAVEAVLADASDAVEIRYPAWRLGAFGSMSGVVAAAEGHRRLCAARDPGASVVLAAARDGIGAVVYEGAGGAE